MKISIPSSLPRARRAPAGFTFLELIVVMAVILIMAALTFSNFKRQMVQMRLQGDATAISNTLQRARSTALRRSLPVVAEADATTNEIAFFFDENDNQTWDADEEEAMPALALTQSKNPATSVLFWAGDDASPVAANAIDGFTPRAGLLPVVVFESDGAVRDLGAFRIGMGPDPAPDKYSGNWMEIRLVTLASARPEIRKYIPGHATPYQPKIQTSNGPNWQWYQ